MDIKALAVFLPFAAAALIGVTYAVNERIFRDINISTYMLIYYVIGVVIIVVMHRFLPYQINFRPLFDKTVLAWTIVSVLASIAAWIIAIFVTINISATYAAMGEIAYPFFTAVFGYLLFGRSFDLSTILGGLLIFTGSAILISGKLKIGS